MQIFCYRAGTDDFRAAHSDSPCMDIERDLDLLQKSIQHLHQWRKTGYLLNIAVTPEWTWTAFQVPFHYTYQNHIAWSFLWQIHVAHPCFWSSPPRPAIWHGFKIRFKLISLCRFNSSPDGLAYDVLSGRIIQCCLNHICLVTSTLLGTPHPVRESKSWRC